jgi:hypothetical protein
MLPKYCSIFFFFYIVVLGVHCGIYKRSYNITNIPYLNSLPPSLSFISPYAISGTGSTGLIFPFTCMCIHYLYHIHPLTPFPHILPSSTGTKSLRQNMFCLLFSDFVKEKKWHLCLFQITIWEVSLFFFQYYYYERN